ncbi:hypothetical protein [Gillisia sp. CAL575]|uniref:hypothetical protein n=1 Tax=Gillisia sp. CAL575 TaxID=985255 RepID=UPI0012FA4421|nr:hypothetical protein [Gillisia sp. CAL575]
MRKKSKYGMPPPKTRAEFERNVNLIIEEIRMAEDRNDDDLLRNRSFFTFRHLNQLQYFPNQRIEIRTINELLRNQANMTNWMSLMNKP